MKFKPLNFHTRKLFVILVIVMHCCIVVKKRKVAILCKKKKKKKHDSKKWAVLELRLLKTSSKVCLFYFNQQVFHWALVIIFSTMLNRIECKKHTIWTLSVSSLLSSKALCLFSTPASTHSMLLWLSMETVFVATIEITWEKQTDWLLVQNTALPSAPSLDSWIIHQGCFLLTSDYLRMSSPPWEPTLAMPDDLQMDAIWHH